VQLRRDATITYLENRYIIVRAFVVAAIAKSIPFSGMILEIISSHQAPFICILSRRSSKYLLNKELSKGQNQEAFANQHSGRQAIAIANLAHYLHMIICRGFCNEN
jgi:hypothetical protein